MDNIDRFKKENQLPVSASRCAVQKISVPLSKTSYLKTIGCTRVLRDIGINSGAPTTAKYLKDNCGASNVAKQLLSMSKAVQTAAKPMHGALEKLGKWAMDSQNYASSYTPPPLNSVHSINLGDLHIPNTEMEIYHKLSDLIEISEDHVEKSCEMRDAILELAQLTKQNAEESKRNHEEDSKHGRLALKIAVATLVLTGVGVFATVLTSIYF